MSHCFKREVLHIEGETLFEDIDACYVITMTNSTRRENYMKQLKTYKPFHKINIIHNKGFKKCNKEPWVTNTVKDITDIYGRIFIECLHLQYDKVLIFEDDFFFTESFDNLKKITNDIEMFLNNHPKFMTYNLGAIALFMFPMNKNHFLYKGAGAQSIIYSSQYMKKYIVDYKNRVCLSDMFWNKYYENYTYSKAICFQLFPRTENSNNWFKFLGIFDSNLLCQTLFQADKTHEKFFPFMYTFSKTWYVVLILFYFILNVKKSELK